MSNRNFDNRVVIQRLQNQVYARNLYKNNILGQQIINNPQNSDGNASRFNTFVPGAQTDYFRGLTGNGETISIGGTVNIPPYYVSLITPSAPTINSIISGNSQLTINFTPSLSTDTPITNYQYSINAGSTWTTFSPASTISPFIISGLTNGTSYQITIRAVNVAGPGVPSNIVSATPFTSPSAPTIDYITPGNQQLTVNFTPGANGGSHITNYQYSINAGSTWTTVLTTSSPFIITGLINGASYSVLIRAINAAGSGAQSNVVSATPYTTPDAPTINSITSGNQQLTVNFTPGATGGSPITNYQYSITTPSFWIALSPPSTSSSIVITGLTNGTSYPVSIRAVNAAGSGTSSATQNATPNAPSNVPNPPTSLIGVGGNQAIYVLFTPGSDNGSAITNYQYSIDGGNTFTAFSPAQTFSPVEISNIGLTNGTSYNVQLKAVNAAGLSIASVSVSVTPTTNTLNTSNLLVELDANNTSSYSGSGTSWTNLRSGGSYSATLQNSPIFDVTNKWFTFNGTNQIAQIAQAAAINPTVGSAFTAQIWARVNTSSPNFNNNDGLISKQFGFPLYDGYSLSLSVTGAVILNMNGQSVNGNYPSATGVYNNSWALYTIVVRFGGGSANPSYAYVSTRRVVTASNGETLVPPTAPLQFPRGIQETNANFCPADVGAFYLYNTAVSQEDIIRNYDATKSRYGL